jgi:hypothetical protein
VEFSYVRNVVLALVLMLVDGPMPAANKGVNTINIKKIITLDPIAESLYNPLKIILWIYKSLSECEYFNSFQPRHLSPKKTLKGRRVDRKLSLF